MNIFFSFRNRETACGMWSTAYIITLVVDLLLIAISLYLFRKASKNTVRKILIIMGIWTTATEIVKQVFMAYQDGVGDVEFLPLYFCSLFMFCSFMATSKNITVRTAGSSFLFFGGIIGATTFFIYPNACIPNYPIYHFMCIRTMLFHGSMIFSGLLIVISGYYTPSIKHFKHYFVTMSIICALAYLFNTLLGWDLMYMSKPLGFSISQNIYDLAPNIYPFIFMTLEIFVPFFISYFAYFLIMKIIGYKHD